MLIRHTVLDGIRAGRITQAFRRWRRPTVRSGGTLLTAAGELAITSVERVTLDEIGTRDAELAGYSDRDTLAADLTKKKTGEFYRVRFGALRPDPRIALRQTPADDPAERQALIERLRRIDTRSSAGPWTREVLELIAANPGVRAGDLCAAVGQERRPFKTNVRKLKSLGLTESLKIGYRLSPRGQALLEAIRDRNPER